ncbi:MAG: hypothetical protein AAGH38_08475 [Pseudomonadota bacterium]
MKISPYILFAILCLSQWFFGPSASAGASEARYWSVMSAARDLVPFEAPRIVYVSERGASWGPGASEADAVTIERGLEILSDSRQDLVLALAAGRYELAQSIVVSKWRGDASTAIIGSGADTVVTGAGASADGNDGTSFAAFRLGAGNTIIARLTIDGFGACVDVAGGAVSNNVALTDIFARNVRSCVVVQSRKPKTVKRWRIENISVAGFEKSAIRLSGPKISDIDIRNLSIDGRTEEPTSECHKAGVDIRSGAHDIRVIDASISNIFGECGDRYQQGDGVSIDSKGGKTRDILLEDVRVLNARDGGFDIKGVNIQMRGLHVSTDVYSSYAFRLWPVGPYTCDDCSATGKYSALVFAHETEITFNGFSTDGYPDRPVCDLRRSDSEHRAAEVRILLARGQTLAPLDVTAANSDPTGKCLTY